MVLTMMNIAMLCRRVAILLATGPVAPLDRPAHCSYFTGRH
jgi:hypothetical protein